MACVCLRTQAAEFMMNIWRSCRDAEKENSMKISMDEIFSMQSDTDMRIFEGFQAKPVEQTHCAKCADMFFSLFISNIRTSCSDIQPNNKSTMNSSSTEIRMCLRGRAANHLEFQ